MISTVPISTRLKDESGMIDPDDDDGVERGNFHGVEVEGRTFALVKYCAELSVDEPVTDKAT